MNRRLPTRPPTSPSQPVRLTPRIPSTSTPSPSTPRPLAPQNQHARKSTHATSHRALPKELTELLNRTCSLAADSPHAAALLQTALSSLDAQLSETPPPRDGTGAENRDPNASPPYLQMSPRARAQLSNLRRDAAADGLCGRDNAGASSSSTTLGSSRRGAATARARCIMPAPGEHAPPLWTTAPPPSPTGPLPPPPAALHGPLSAAQLQRKCASLVGQHVSVYCYIDDVWRTAVVTALLPDGAHELVYLDGYTERTVLECRLWRRVSG